MALHPSSYWSPSYAAKMKFQISVAKAASALGHHADRLHLRFDGCMVSWLWCCKVPHSLPCKSGTSSPSRKLLHLYVSESEILHGCKKVTLHL